MSHGDYDDSFCSGCHDKDKRYDKYSGCKCCCCCCQEREKPEEQSAAKDNTRWACIYGTHPDEMNGEGCIRCGWKPNPEEMGNDRVICKECSGCKCIFPCLRGDPVWARQSRYVEVNGQMCSFGGAKRQVGTVVPVSHQQDIHRSTPAEDVLAIVGPPHCKVAEEYTGQFNETLEQFYKDLKYNDLFLKTVAMTKILMDQQCEKCNEAILHIQTKHKEAVLHLHKEQKHWDLHEIPQKARDEFDSDKGIVQISGECQLERPSNTPIKIHQGISFAFGFDTSDLGELREFKLNRRLTASNTTRNPVYNMAQNKLSITGEEHP